MVKCPKLFVVSKDNGLQYFELDYNEVEDSKPNLFEHKTVLKQGETLPENVVQDSHGNTVALQYLDRVCVYDMKESFDKFCSLPGMYRTVDLSPKGTFLVTGTSLTPEVQDNLVVYNSSNCEAIIKLREKFFKGEEMWPLLSWSEDERYISHRVKNAVTIYEMSTKEVLFKIRYERVLTSKLAPNPYARGIDTGFLLGLFATEQKSLPAKFSIGSIDSEGKLTTLTSKSIFRATEAQMEWNKQSTHMLVKCECANDATGQSYYGETSLWLLNCSGDCISINVKKGGIKDFCWNARGREFISISGTMPSKITLHNLKGENVFSLGELHRNYCNFNHFGRFLAVAGFGNLPGDLDFWDFSAKVPIRMGGSIANCPVDTYWSPCGRYFLSASTFPRRRQDNVLEVFTYFGKKILNLPFQQLLKAQWINNVDNFTDRPRNKNIKEEKLVEKREKYIPPALRGKVKSSKVGSLSNESKGSKMLMKQRDKGPSKSQLKNLKRKEKKLQAKMKELEEQKKLEKENASSLTEQEKKVRKITKQLKAITLLEEKQKNGETLNEAQILKLSKKKAFEEELQALTK